MPDNNLSSLSDSDLISLLQEKISSMTPEDISGISDEEKLQLLEHKNLLAPETAKAIEVSATPEDPGFLGSYTKGISDNISGLINLPETIKGLGDQYQQSPEANVDLSSVGLPGNSIPSPISFLSRKAMENPRTAMTLAAAPAAAAAGVPAGIAALFPSIADMGMDQIGQLLGTQEDTPMANDLGRYAANITTDAGLYGAGKGLSKVASNASDVMPAPRGERVPITPETTAALGVAERGPGSLGNTLQRTADEFIQNPVAAPSESAALRSVEKLALGNDGLASELSVPQGRSDRAVVSSKRLREATPKIFESRIAQGGDVYDPVSGTFLGDAGRRLSLDDYAQRAQTASDEILKTRKSYLKGADQVIEAYNRDNVKSGSPGRIRGISPEDVDKVLSKDSSGRGVYEMIDKRRSSSLTVDEALSMRDQLRSVFDDISRGTETDAVTAIKAANKVEDSASTLLKEWMRNKPEGMAHASSTLSETQALLENINHYERMLGVFDEAFEAKQMNGTPSVESIKSVKGSLASLTAARKAIQKVMDERLSKVHDVVKMGGDHLPEMATAEVGAFQVPSLKILNDRFAALQPFKDEVARALEETSMSAQVGTNAPMSLKSPNRGDPSINASVAIPGTPIRTSARNALDYGKKAIGIDVPTESAQALQRGEASSIKPGQNIQAYGQIREGGGLGQFGDPELRSGKARSLAHKLEATSDYARVSGLYLTGITPQKSRIERSVEGIPTDLPNRLQEVLPQEVLAPVLLKFKEAQSTGDDKALTQVMGGVLKSFPEVRKMFSPSLTGAPSEFNGVVTDPEDVQLLQVQVFQGLKSGEINPEDAGIFLSDINGHKKPRLIPSAIKPKKSVLNDTIQSILGQ